MEEALSRLHEQKERFDYFFDSLYSDHVQQCLKWKFEKQEDTVRMTDTLRQLAITGFVPLKDIHDPIAKVICKNDVGVVVKSYGKVIGLRPEVWQQTEFKNGIVPATQLMRLVIAKMLA